MSSYPHEMSQSLQSGHCRPGQAGTIIQQHCGGDRGAAPGGLQSVQGQEVRKFDGSRTSLLAQNAVSRKLDLREPDMHAEGGFA